MGWLSSRSGEPGTMLVSELSQGTTFRWSSSQPVSAVMSITRIGGNRYRVVSSMQGTVSEQELDGDSKVYL